MCRWGMFLSGGIDSSAIAAMMSGMVDEPIKTFSVAFREREANELGTRLVARNTRRTITKLSSVRKIFCGVAETDLARRRTAGPSFERRFVFRI